MQPDSTGQMINTQPSPQQLPDPNVASLVPTQGSQMSPDQSMAALAFATHISSKALMAEHGVQSGQPDGATAPQDAPEDTQPAPAEEKAESGMEARLIKQIDTLKEQITNNHQSDEIARIRQELTDLIKEDHGEQK